MTHEQKPPVRYTPPKDLADDAGMRMLLPVGRSIWAIASGYLGLISVLLVPGPLAVLTASWRSVTCAETPSSTAWAGRSSAS